MPLDQDLQHALQIVQSITNSPNFLEFSAEPIQVEKEQQDPVGALRSRGVILPPEIRHVVAKRRHPSQLEWDREWRSGGIEWQFFVDAGPKRFRFVYICDPWARDLPASASVGKVHAAAHHEQHQTETEGAELVKDVVCGMDVDPTTAPAKSEYQGKTYYFCAPGCKTRFDRDPGRYVAA